MIRVYFAEWVPDPHNPNVSIKHLFDVQIDYERRMVVYEGKEIISEYPFEVVAKIEKRNGTTDISRSPVVEEKQGRLSRGNIRRSLPNRS